MKRSPKYRLQALMLPGLKRWILIASIGLFVIIYGVLLLLGKHPVDELMKAIRDFLMDYHTYVTSRASGVIVVVLGALTVIAAIARMMSSVLGAYLPSDRESIPDVLYRRRHLDRGPRVVVIGGGTGLSNLLKGLKRYTNNITAIVTVGDDGGSSGRLRQEMGVLPPGDIRNCITALADEEKLVTELFRYRFEQGQGLEGHSFGNLFLTALCAITHNDMLEAVRTASRVLNSCGQVLPSTLSNIALVAELEDGRTVKGESQIPEADGRIKRLSCEPSSPLATPEAVQAILSADLIVLGPGSLYTSIIPNLLVRGIPDALRESRARKVYVCNVMTQKGETTDYSVSDHVAALLEHMGVAPRDGYRLVNAVLVNNEPPSPAVREAYAATGCTPVLFDPEKLRHLSVRPYPRSLLSRQEGGHHDPQKLAQMLMFYYYRRKNQKPKKRRDQNQPAGKEPALKRVQTETVESRPPIPEDAIKPGSR